MRMLATIALLLLSAISYAESPACRIVASATATRQQCTPLGCRTQVGQSVTSWSNGVLVGLDAAQGAGLVIGTAHAVTGSQSVRVEIDGVMYAAGVFATDDTLDLAALRVSDLTGDHDVAAVVDLETAADDGAQVVLFGFERASSRITRRSAVYRYRSRNGSMFQNRHVLWLPVIEGDSGTGIYDAEGRLTGIVSFRDPQSGNDAGIIPGAAIHRWLVSIGCVRKTEGQRRPMQPDAGCDCDSRLDAIEEAIRQIQSRPVPGDNAAAISALKLELAAMRLEIQGRKCVTPEEVAALAADMARQLEQLRSALGDRKGVIPQSAIDALSRRIAALEDRKIHLAIVRDGKVLDVQGYSASAEDPLVIESTVRLSQ